MEIRQATRKDFIETATFDLFAGDRNSEIARNEVWTATMEDTIAGYITFNHSFYRKPFINT